VEDDEGVRRGSGSGEGSEPGACVLCMAAWICAVQQSLLLAESRVRGGTRLTATDTETLMQHFHVGNRHQIKDAPPNTWATVHCRDVVTMSELARRGFHLVDMSGEVWTMHREG
jgi:hypothetical protein